MKTMHEIQLSDYSREITDKIKNSVKQILPDATVILFGSRARGDAAADADRDVLVLTNKVDAAIERKVYAALYDVELDEDAIINVIVIARHDWEHDRFDGHPMKRNVEKEGIMVA